MPTDQTAKALSRLVGSGVDVAILTNSLAATDVAAVHSGYAHYRPQLIKGGVRLFELQPYGRASEISLFGSSGTGLHTKAFVADGRVGFIGSFSFDPRSASLNTEMGALFDHAHLPRRCDDCSSTRPRFDELSAMAADPLAALICGRRMSRPHFLLNRS